MTEEKLFRIETEKIVNGTNLFRDTPIVSFSGDLSSLETGSYMFSESQLEHFDWKGGNEEITSSSFQGDTYSMFQYCPLNHIGLKNAIDMAASSSAITGNSISLDIFANKNSYEVCRYLYSLSGEEYNANSFYQGLQNGEYDTYVFSGVLPNGVMANITVHFTEKPFEYIVYGDEMFLGLYWVGARNSYEDGAFVWDVETTKIKTAYRMFYNAGGFGVGLGEGPWPTMLVVRGAFPELENAKEMFRFNYDDPDTGDVYGEYHLLLDLTPYSEDMPCRINNVENMVDGQHISHEESLNCIKNIADNCVCTTDQHMGDIQLASFSSWGGELYTGNLEATTTDIYSYLQWQYS